jgi:hypothetical protein
MKVWKLARRARRGTTAARRLIGLCMARYVVRPEDTHIWITALGALENLGAADRALDFLCDRTASHPPRGPHANVPVRQGKRG